jgi:hypothetical protein
MKKLKNKKDIIVAIEAVTHDAAYQELMLHITNWSSFNSEKFTPTRYATRMRVYGKRLIDLGNDDKGRAIIDLAKEI